MNFTTTGDNQDEHSSPAPQAPNRRSWAGWITSIATTPAIMVALLPNLTCVVCWPAYVGALSAMGVGFLVDSVWLFWSTVALLILAVASLAFRAPQRRGYGPFVCGLISSIVLLAGKFAYGNEGAAEAGVWGLVAASIWNCWPRARSTNCTSCDPTRPDGCA